MMLIFLSKVICLSSGTRPISYCFKYAIPSRTSFHYSGTKRQTQNTNLRNETEVLIFEIS
jgi:hypothetical protein